MCLCDGFGLHCGGILIYLCMSSFIDNSWNCLYSRHMSAIQINTYYPVVVCCLQGRDKVAVKLARTDDVIQVEDEDIEKVFYLRAGHFHLL